MLSAYTAALMQNSQSNAGNAAIAAGQGANAMKGKMSEDKIDAVAKDFEAMFLSQMMEIMFGDTMGEDAFGDRETAEVYKGMMVEQYGKQIAQSGGIGIASYVKTELLKLQESPADAGVRFKPSTGYKLNQTPQ